MEGKQEGAKKVLWIEEEGIRSRNLTSMMSVMDANPVPWRANVDDREDVPVSRSEPGTREVESLASVKVGEIVFAREAAK